MDGIIPSAFTQIKTGAVEGSGFFVAFCLELGYIILRITNLTRRMEQEWRTVSYSGRPITPQFAVVHAAGEIIGGTAAYDFFVELKIGAHALIYPDGKIVRMMDTSKLIGQAKNHNSVSFGAEFLIAGDHSWESFVDAMTKPECDKYTDAQYEAAGGTPSAA